MVEPKAPRVPNTKEQDIAYHKAMIKFMMERGFMNLARHHQFCVKDLTP